MYILSIEGNIGTGKSTIIKIIKEMIPNTQIKNMLIRRIMMQIIILITIKTTIHKTKINLKLHHHSHLKTNSQEKVVTLKSNHLSKKFSKKTVVNK